MQKTQFKPRFTFSVLFPQTAPVCVNSVPQGDALESEVQSDVHAANEKAVRNHITCLNSLALTCGSLHFTGRGSACRYEQCC